MTATTILRAIVLELAAPADAELNGHLGRGNYAATLARVREFDPALARELHDGQSHKPFTCSGVLRPDTAHLRLRKGDALRVRVTGLTARVSDCLHAALVECRPEVWDLDGVRFDVVRAVCDRKAEPWSGQATYEQLADAHLFAPGPPARSVTLEFVAPTSFRSNGLNMPLPLPALVFGSLWERWNRFSPYVLDEGVKAFAGAHVAVSRCTVSTRPVKQQGLRIGGVGVTTYTALAGDAARLTALHILADFAFYGGVGVQTANGMGLARRLEQTLKNGGR